MNYPDGMTKEDWTHIDGENHYSACPMHEDNSPHQCGDGLELSRPICHCAMIDEDARIAADRARRVAKEESWA